jgi:NAD(P)H-hydrate epimerase
MREAEDAAFARGITAEALMDQAGAGIARAVTQFFPRAGQCIVFVGKGHNAGDALVAALHLQEAGWKIDLRLAFPEEECAELTRKHLRMLRDADSGSHPNAATVEALNSLSPSPTIVLDGLLGLGAKELLREPIRSAAKEVNRLRREKNAFVFAVDIPTGVSGDSGETDPEDCVGADFTLTIGFAKHGLIVDSALEMVGRIEVIPLPDLIAPESAGKETLAAPHALRSLLPRRKFGAYKNQFGRIGILAGSEGTTGAAILTAEGALRAGAGLVHLYVPRDLYSLMAATAPSEAMVHPFRSLKELAEEKVDVWAVGPGLGTDRAADVIKFIDQARQPMVIDADALTMLGAKTDILKRSPGPRLLTPHPGEMKRLIDPGKMSRAGTARHFCEQFPVTLLLKGSRTVVCERVQPLSYNSTGNPGMATGGMGDALTGVCAGLIGRGLTPYDAGRIGAWVCGRAAEISIFQNGASEESLLPRDVLVHLGDAFNELRNSIV